MSINSENKIKIQAENVNFYYGKNHAIKNLNINIYDNKVTALSARRAAANQHF
jgi:ABC-type phosphate transport system ATPase subunit